MSTRPSTVLVVGLVLAAVLAGGFYLGRGILHESKSLASAASEQTTPSSSPSAPKVASPTHHGHSKKRVQLEVLAGVGAVGALGLLVFCFQAFGRQHHRERWRAP